MIKLKKKTTEERVLRLIETERVNTFRLAQSLGVSTPTVLRIIKKLRSQGINICSVREGNSWFYEVRKSKKTTYVKAVDKDPIWQLQGLISSGVKDASIKHDTYIYRTKKKKVK
ncbi:MAG: HTH domain protein [Candidatus Scalindua rubra]|uniref:HTH domain protein n=1 Tax=Candidatus Scalindua rubra TaxID=1872076 RepID=A0A1E3XCV2_9BACT|nr:MAG: HTH domain protein [Candidatus Scalindua rubra]